MSLKAQIEYQETKYILAEIYDDNVKIYDKNLFKEISEQGISIPYNESAKFNGKRLIYPYSDSDKTKVKVHVKFVQAFQMEFVNAFILYAKSTLKKQGYDWKDNKETTS